MASLVMRELRESNFYFLWEKMKKLLKITLGVMLTLLIIVSVIWILSYKEVWVDDSWCPDWMKLSNGLTMLGYEIKPWITSCNDCELTRSQYELWEKPIYNDECKNIKKTCYVCTKLPPPWCYCIAEYVNIKVDNLTWYLYKLINPLRNLFLRVIVWWKNFSIKLAYLIA